MYQNTHINKLIIIFCITLNLLSYEKNFYSNYYYLLNAVGFIIIFLNLFKDKKLPNLSWSQKSFIFIFIFIASVQILHNEIIDAIKLFVASAVILTVAKFDDEYKEDYLKILQIIAFITTPFFLIVEFFPNNFWPKIYDRNSSFFFDPNYAGAFYALACTLALCNNIKKTCKLCFFYCLPYLYNNNK